VTVIIHCLKIKPAIVIVNLNINYVKGLCHEIVVEIKPWSGGVSRCDGRDMPTVAPTIVRMATLGRIRSRVIAKSAGSGEPVFTLMDVLLYGLSH
jgi:hypothetical protein